MIRFLIKRVAFSLLVILLVTSGVYLLVYGYGDPAATTLGQNASQDALRAFNEKHCLDQPISTSYASFIGISPCCRPDVEDGGYCGVLQGDMGSSFLHEDPVFDVIGRRLPRTLLLGTLAIGFEVLLGLFFGIIAALRRNTLIDTIVMSGAYLGISLPTYVTGPIFLLVFAFLYGWFPVGGYGHTWSEHLYHALLPAFTLATVGTATYARVMRSEMLDTLSADHVRTASAKGLSKSAVVWRHAVRNALLPIVTLVGLSLPLIASGSIITEAIFAWPGMGSLAIEAITKYDAPTVLGVVIVVSAMVQFGNLLADICVALLDPRIRLGKK